MDEYNYSGVDKIIDITRLGDILYGISELGILYRYSGNHKTGGWVKVATPPVIMANDTISRGATPASAVISPISDGLTPVSPVDDEPRPIIETTVMTDTDAAQNAAPATAPETAPTPVADTISGDPGITVSHDETLLNQ